MVLRHQHFGLAAPAVDGIVDVFGPGQRLTDFGAAQGVGVVQRMRDVFSGLDGFLLFDVPAHFRRRFRAGCHHKIVGQPVDGALFASG